MAHAFIDAIANAGADGVKFQAHIAAAESTPFEPWRVRFSVQDESRYAYWRRMEFTPPQWLGLKQHAEERGLAFICSPFSVEATELLKGIGVSAWKIASGEVASSSMFESIAETGLPVLLSSGLSPLSELDSAVAKIQARNLPYVVLQCTSSYPCAPEHVGLNMLGAFRERYHCAVGLSDHSGTIFAGLAAATLGISALEVHVTFSREMFGPDVAASVTTAELRQLIDGVRFIERMISHPVDKDKIAQELAPLRTMFSKSVVARMSLREGTVLRPEHLAVRKPGGGVPELKMSALLNRKLKRTIMANAPIAMADLE
ncbi:MAG: N-acetylneuraminate synthase family protein [Acidobacteria bacterium]|nr:N-acetylneuraminate synthase family protein [Acidobacteriota bacterium]